MERPLIPSVPTHAVLDRCAERHDQRTDARDADTEQLTGDCAASRIIDQDEQDRDT